MASNGSVPWYNRPAREYPVKRWLHQQYPFTISPALFARPTTRPFCPYAPARPFPAKVWVMGQRAGD